MKITIRFLGAVQEATGSDYLNIELFSGKVLKDLINKLDSMYGSDFREKVLDSKAENINRTVTILLNGKNILAQDGLNTEIRDGDIVVILPAAVGG